MREIRSRARAIAPTDVVRVVERYDLHTDRDRGRVERGHRNGDRYVGVGLRTRVRVDGRDDVLVADGRHDVGVRVFTLATRTTRHVRDQKERRVADPATKDPKGLAIPLGRQSPVKSHRSVEIAAL